MFKPLLFTDRIEGTLDELGPLIRLRHAYADGHRVSAVRLAEFDERFAAQIDALAVYGDDLGGLLEPFLTADDPDITLAALLGHASQSAAAAALIPTPWEALFPVSDDVMVVDAIARVASTTWIDGMRKTAFTPGRSPGRRAALAMAIVAAYRQPLDPSWSALLTDQAPAARHLAWWSAGLTTAQITKAALVAGIDDTDPAVQAACFTALAWRGNPQFSELLIPRLLSQDVKPSPEAKLPPKSPLWLLAARVAQVGNAPLLAAVRARAQQPDAGLARCSWLAALGMPPDVEMLLMLIGDPDRRLGVAAGDAFTDLTGSDIDSTHRLTIVPEDAQPDDDPEFFPERWLPDPAKAAAAWAKLRDTIPPGSRLCQGTVFRDEEPNPEQRLDRFSARSVALRRALYAGEARPSWA